MTKRVRSFSTSVAIRGGWGFLVAWTCFLGCTGTVGSLISGESQEEQSDLTCEAFPEVSDPGAIRRLSATQYTNTVRDLTQHFGVSLTVENPFPARGVTATFSTSYLSNTVSSATATTLLERAEAVSSTLVQDLTRLLDCAPSGTAKDPCIEGFVARFAFRAFRRPPTAEEQKVLVDLYNVLVPTIGAADSVRAVIEAVLQSPHFLYIDGGVELAAAKRSLFDGYAMANRLSYFLWDSMPDQALFDAAASGALLEPEGIDKEIDRMLSAPRAAPVMRAFHQEWLRLARAGTIHPNPQEYPDFTPELGTSIAEETGRFIDRTVWRDGGSLRDLLLGRPASVDGGTADLYGVQPDAFGADGWGDVLLPADRRGIFTRAHYLASHGPVNRGVVLIDRLLCLPLRAPDNVDTTLPELPPASGPITPRELFSQHSSKSECSGCHRIIDPIGFSFDHYGEDGRYRDVYANGLAVDTRGRIETPAQIEFDGAGSLLDQLAVQPAVHACYAERLSEWAVGRGLGDAERCAVQSYSDPSQPVTIAKLLGRIASSDLMRFRGPSESKEGD